MHHTPSWWTPYGRARWNDLEGFWEAGDELHRQSLIIESADEMPTHEELAAAIGSRLSPEAGRPRVYFVDGNLAYVRDPDTNAPLGHVEVGGRAALFAALGDPAFEDFLTKTTPPQQPRVRGRSFA